MRIVSRFDVTVLSLAAGIAWIVQGLVSLILPDPSSALDVTMIVPMLLTACSSLALLPKSGAIESKLGRVALYVFTVSIALILPAQIGAAVDSELLTKTALPLAALTFAGGLILTGAAIVRGKRLPAWSGWALIASQFLAIAVGIALSPISPLADHGDYTGALAHGVVWMALWWKVLGAPGGGARPRVEAPNLAEAS